MQVDPTLSSSRIASDDRTPQAADDGNVTGWVLTDEFIVAIQLDETIGPWTASYKLQWRQVGGTFADFGAATELAYGTGTVLVNGNPVTDTGPDDRICTNTESGAWLDGVEVEGTGTVASFEMLDEEWTELQFAIDPSNAIFDQQYEFQLYDITNGAAVGSAGALITMQVAPPVEINQTSFRVRSDDSQALNEPTVGWAGAQSADVSIDLGQRFRIRFEIEESAGSTFNTAVKLQHNKNTGGWVDTYSYPDIDPLANPVVWCRESDTYTDLDPTTNLLTGSAESFTAGYGNDDAACPAISLHEFVIVIPTLYDGAARNIVGDEFDFRLVEDDGTPFTGSYDNPRITMTHRPGYIGGTGIESPGFIGPVKDGNGNLYWACEPSETDPLVIMLKSTDGGGEWLEMDGAGRPTTEDFESGAVALVDDVLHLVIDNGDNATYHQFNVSSNGTTPDTWVVVDQEIAAYANTDQSGAVQACSDGTVVAFYRKTVGNEGIYFKRRSAGGTWGGETELDTTASTEFTAVMTVLGENDLIHIFYKDDTNLLVLHKSLTIGDSLSAAEEVISDASDTGGGQNWAMTNAVYWDSSGVEKIMILVMDDTNEYLYSVVIEDDGTPGTPKLVDAVVVANNAGGMGTRQPNAMLAVDPATNTLYCYYTDLATFDIWKIENVDDGTWEADPTEMHDEVFCEVIRGNVFTHSAGNGSATVVGYIWENDSAGLTGYQEYSEYELAASGVTISCAVGVLTLTGNTATILKGGVSIDPTNPGSIALTGNTAVVTSPPPAQTISCSAPGIITLTGNTSNVLPGAIVVSCPTPGQINLTGNQATIIGGAVTVSCPAPGVLTLTGNVADIVLGPVTISCSVGTLTLSGNTADVVPGPITISCSVGTLTLTGNQAALSSPPPAQTINCAVGTLTLTGNTASIVPGAKSVPANVGTLTLTGNLADVVPGGTVISCSVGVVTLTGNQASISTPPPAQTINCAVGVVTLFGQTADIVTGPVTVACQIGTLTLSGNSANVVLQGAPQTISCSVGVLTLTGNSASVVPGPVTVSCAVGTLTLTGNQASISSLEGQVISCSAGSLSLTGNQASVVTGAISISCSITSLELQGNTSDIVPGAVSISCSVGIVTLSGNTASISSLPPAQSISCSVGIVTLTGQGATILVGSVLVGCQIGEITLSGNTADIVPGPIVVPADVGTLTLIGLQATAQIGIPNVKGYVTVDNYQLYDLTIGNLRVDNVEVDNE